MNEQESIDTFVESVIKRVRPKGTNVAVSTVLLVVIRAAANIAVRNEDGTIDTSNAHKILDDAVILLGRLYGQV